VNSWRVRGRRLLARRRRPLAALLAAAAVLLALPALRPRATSPIAVGTTVLVAARDLPAGAVLAPGDVRAVPYPPARSPEGAAHTVSAVVGRRAVLPLRRGEPITDVRLLDDALLRRLAPAGDDLVAAPVRIADAGEVALVRAGDRVDVLAGPAAGADVGGAASTATPQAATTLLHAALVLTVPAPASASAADGGLILVSARPAEAAALAAAAATSRLSLVLHP
jgi:Flp pilus assembly protein CpaB